MPFHCGYCNRRFPTIGTVREHLQSCESTWLVQEIARLQAKLKLCCPGAKRLAWRPDNMEPEVLVAGPYTLRPNGTAKYDAYVELPGTPGVLLVDSPLEACIAACNEADARKETGAK